MSATRVIAHIIVHNGVACGAHVFAKLKFANNIFLDQFANFNARQNNWLYGSCAPAACWCQHNCHSLYNRCACARCPSWLSFLAVLPGCPSWLSFLAVFHKHHLSRSPAFTLVRGLSFAITCTPQSFTYGKMYAIYIYAIEPTSVGLAHTCPLTPVMCVLSSAWL